MTSSFSALWLLLSSLCFGSYSLQRPIYSIAHHKTNIDGIKRSDRAAYRMHTTADHQRQLQQNHISHQRNHPSNNTHQDMLIKKRHPFTGVETIRDIDISPEEAQLLEESNEVIQAILPHLSVEDREFLMTGFTGEDWDAIFPPEMAEEKVDKRIPGGDFGTSME